MVAHTAEPIDTDAVIIGAGPVGLFQAFQLRLLEINCHIVDALPHTGGQCAELYGDKPIYDIPGTVATTGHGLAEALLQQIAPFKVPMHLGEQVVSLQREPDGRLRLSTTRGTVFVAKTVFIAAGVGAFVPRRIGIEGLEHLEGTLVFYHPDTLDRFTGQTVVVNGCDDSALATALALVGKAQSVTLLHRRDGFQANPALVADMRAQVASGALHFMVGQPAAYDGQQLQVTVPDGTAVAVATEALVACLGVSPRLGPIADWGLALERKQLVVDTATFATHIPGIYAVGDAIAYLGKRKLIVSGFHEATLAAFGAAEMLAGEKIPLEYTTSSARLQRRLGVAPSDH